MAQLKFLRCAHVIRTINEDGTFTDQHYTFRDPNHGWKERPSISAAKRASRKLQEENGGLGKGSLVRVQKLHNAGEEA
jgi:hypothetical protein